MAVKNMGKAKNTAQIQSCRRDCSWMVMAFRLLFPFSHMGERAYIVTQSIKKLKKDDRDPHGFKRVSDDHPVDIAKLSTDDKGLYYKDIPYTTSKLHQRLIVTYSPKYALYQRSLRKKQVERAQKMLCSGSTKKNHKNPNDPARFIANSVGRLKNVSGS